MTVHFDPHLSLVIISAIVCGPNGEVDIEVALDTGATHTFIRKEILEGLGYFPDESVNKVTVATGGGLIYSPVIDVEAIQCMGSQRMEFGIHAVPLAEEASVDGLIGLDFLRDHALKIDFRNGIIEFA